MSATRPVSAALPEPDPDAARASAALAELIRDEIARAGGWLSFARYMELALYAPGLGYYSGGAQKFGAAGDFVTAPELSPLFARSLARIAQAVLGAGTNAILEFGAGSGALAAELLAELARYEALPARYLILELSGELRARQQARIESLGPAITDRVRWIDALPANFEGLMLANEVLDAMPVHLVQWQGHEILERGVAWEDDRLVWQDRLAHGALLEAAQRLPVAPPYLSEINLAARAWLQSCAASLTRGALLLIDYGFPQVEFYHPQRATGTLMCHYRHRSHTDPLWLPGLNDITAHVDFTAVADAGTAAGLALEGYTSQAALLLECGMLEALAEIGAPDSTDYLRAAAAAQKLISPSEMGELFKAIAFSRGLEVALPGFARGDRSHTL